MNIQSFAKNSLAHGAALNVPAWAAISPGARPKGLALLFEFPKHNVRFVVKYNEKRHQFCIAHPDELDLKYFNPWQCPDESWIEEFMKDAVLIGNIYDNKELLK